MLADSGLAGGVHHREDVLGALLERRRPVEPIRQADPSLVEADHAQVAGHVLEEAAVVLVLPDDLAVRDERRDGEDVGPLTELLPGDAQPSGVGELDLGHLHAGSTAPNASRSRRYTSWCRPRGRQSVAEELGAQQQQHDHHDHGVVVGHELLQRPATCGRPGATR